MANLSGGLYKKEELISNEIPSIGLSTGKVTTKDDEYSWAIRGAFFRLKYDFMNKYLFEVNGRYDGTSKFPHNSRFGFSPLFRQLGVYLKKVLWNKHRVG